MDIPIIIFSALSLLTSAVCLALLIKVLNSSKSQTPSDRKLNDIQDSIYNEFSRNRTEQSTLSHAQRKELSDRLDEVSRKVDSLVNSNNEHLFKISNDMNRRLAEIKDSNSALIEKQNEKIEASLEKIRESNEKKLDEMRSVVDEKLTNTLTQRLDSSFKTVSEQLENLYKALGEMKEMSSGITDHVSSLNRVLTNVKARGTWAEIQLKNILDQTIPGMYVENFAAKENSKERVEFAVKIPSGDSYRETVYLPIDSKFPMEDYVRLCDAAERGDSEGVIKARRELEEKVTLEAKEITKYIEAPKTTPFAIMYLASEGLYAEIASSQNGILEKLHKKYNIMVSGPSTITALLNSLSMGFKIAAINEKANEVRRVLSAIKGQYDTFGTLLQKAKKKIDEAGRSLDDAQHRNDIIQKKLKSIETISTEEADGILDVPAQETSDEDVE